MAKNEHGKKMGQVITKAWSDEAFKKRLLADATSVFKEEGVRVPEGVTVKVVENSEKVVHIVLPHKPGGGQLTDEQLDAVVGGAGVSHVCWTECAAADQCIATGGDVGKR